MLRGTPTKGKHFLTGLDFRASILENAKNNLLATQNGRSKADNFVVVLVPR